MRRSAVIALLAVLLSLFSFSLAAPANAADSGAEARFLSLINGERTSRGLGALSVRAEVVPVARDWTTRLMADQALSHNPQLSTLMPSDWISIGENVGYGSTADSLHTAFMNSSGHRANILGDFNQVGIGVDRDGAGRMWVTVDFMKTRTPQVAAASPSTAPTGGSGDGATGYYVLGSNGAIYSYGNAAYKGSPVDQGLRIGAVLMTLTPSYDGYWIAGDDGGIFSYGDAEFHGSVPGLNLGARVAAIDLKPTVSGKGYWILGADGGIFSFGDAEFFGSLPGIGVHNRAVRLIPTATGNGYWILGADGGIFSFGDAEFFGSVPGLGLRATGVSMARTATSNGYWILGDDGGIFSFGDAGFYGSVPGVGQNVKGVQLSRTVGGAGYYIVSDLGRVFGFGDGPHFGEPSGILARDIAAVRK